MSKCRDVSIIYTIQVKFSCFLCHIVTLFHMHSCRGGGQAVQASLSDLRPPGYQSKKNILLILLILNYMNVKMYQL